jgi:hypothetical protein
MRTRFSPTWRSRGFAIAASLVLAVWSGRATAQQQAFPCYEVDHERTFVYQQPSSESPVLRRLYLGELVRPLELVTDSDRKRWVKIPLGAASFGYVQADKLALAGKLPQHRYERPKVVRDDRPFSFGARGWGETFGTALNARYLPLTRLGMIVGVGAVLDEKEVRGRSWSAALIAPLALTNLSPVVELGVVNLSYNDGASTLSVLAIYTSLGLEYAFDFGLYIGAGLTFTRSLSIDVSRSWQDRSSGPIPSPSFGSLGKAIHGSSLQTYRPTVTVGFSF